LVRPRFTPDSQEGGVFFACGGRTRRWSRRASGPQFSHDPLALQNRYGHPPRYPSIIQIDIDMPTIKDISGPYRFFFYSFDCNEEMHVHVQRERMICKFWMQPVVLARNQGFAPKELSTIREIILKNRNK